MHTEKSDHLALCGSTTSKTLFIEWSKSVSLLTFSNCVSVEAFGNMAAKEPVDFAVAHMSLQYISMNLFDSTHIHGRQ